MQVGRLCATDYADALETARQHELVADSHSHGEVLILSRGRTSVRKYLRVRQRAAVR